MDYFEVIKDATTGEQTIRPYTEEESAAAILTSIPTPEQQRAYRAEAYRVEADPIFFKAQRGESTMDEWLTKVADIRARYPVPTP